MNDTLTAQDRDACRAACERLCHDFGWHIDHRDYPAFLNLFADDGVFERSEARSSGREELSRFLEGRALDMVTSHIFAGVRIDIHTPEQASGTSTCFVFRTSAEPQQTYPLAMPPMRLVEFHDQFVKTPSGWRFQHRRVSHVFA